MRSSAQRQRKIAHGAPMREVGAECQGFKAITRNDGNQPEAAYNAEAKCLSPGVGTMALERKQL